MNLQQDESCRYGRDQRRSGEGRRREGERRRRADAEGAQAPVGDRQQPLEVGRGLGGPREEDLHRRGRRVAPRETHAANQV